MRKFSYEANGYKKSEVIEFVDYVLDETKRLVSIINKQDEELKKLHEELDKNNEDASTIREMAEYEADGIIGDAKEYASLILNDTLQRAEVLENKNKILEDSINKHKDNLNMIIDEYKSVLEKIDNND
jgi:cell division septum initiation protein DivIVA